MARSRDSFLTEEEKDDLVEKTKAYFEQEREEQLGNMESFFIIDYFVKELGPIISSKVIRRFKEQVEMKLEDAEVEVMTNLDFVN